MKNIKAIKSASVIGVVAGVMMLSGCGEQVANMKDDVTNKIDEGKGIVGGLQDAMKNGVAMKCVSSEDDWVTYTNGTNMRTEGTENGKKQIMVMTEGVTYLWEEGSTTGEKMDPKCFDAMMPENMDMEMPEDEIFEDEFTVESLEAEEEAGKISCSAATDADFSIPKNITFTDQCDIMKKELEKFKEQMPNMPGMDGLPEIPNMPQM
ncbi:MAG: hypothetical protein ACKUBY_01405 [Candidatus Moraniibacteriota bacterium]|jgi:hypothetical protein